MHEQISMDPEAELAALRERVDKLQVRLEDGVKVITSEPDTARRKYFESFFVKLLRDYELTVQVWARKEFEANRDWSDPRISTSKLKEIRDDPEF